MSAPRITFGIIVLNGEPFTKYCLRSLYPFAHEIIVVEGGHENTTSVATPDGHSTDGTLQALLEFQEQEDPEHKVRIVTRDGFWPMRDELGRDRTAQSRAYADRATGDYLWQIDIDEFYEPGAMRRVIETIQADPRITAASFMQKTFWGDPGFWVDSWAVRRGPVQCHRLFKWGPGYTYLTHEPPTVLDPDGVDLRSLRWLTGPMTQRMGVTMYHYSLLFPKQVREKCLVYREEKPEVAEGIVEWSETGYFTLERPYRVHNLYRSPSWLMRYDGPHPPEIARMMEDIRSGRLDVEVRDMSDAERLVDSSAYRVGIATRQVGDHLDRAAHGALEGARAAKRSLLGSRDGPAR